MEHTPGPWRVLKGKGVYGTLKDGSTTLDPVWKSEANWPIIAATPELLEACEKVKSMASKFWLNHDMTKRHKIGALINSITTTLEGAIKKAEGKL